MQFNGQVALVTGASRGIGAAIAETLAQAGAKVIGTATTADGAAAIDARLARWRRRWRLMSLAARKRWMR